MKTQKFNVTGMTCAACQANVTRRVQKLEGVKDVERQPALRPHDGRIR